MSQNVSWNSESLFAMRGGSFAILQFYLEYCHVKEHFCNVPNIHGHPTSSVHLKLCIRGTGKLICFWIVGTVLNDHFLLWECHIPEKVWFRPMPQAASTSAVWFRGLFHICIKFPVTSMWFTEFLFFNPWRTFKDIVLTYFERDCWIINSKGRMNIMFP